MMYGAEEILTRSAELSLHSVATIVDMVFDTP
jgi:hypothetical protein